MNFFAQLQQQPRINQTDSKHMNNMQATSVTNIPSSNQDNTNVKQGDGERGIISIRNTAGKDESSR